MIIYVGAIAILFLFVIMIMNLKLVELESTKNTEYNAYPLAFILSVFLFVSLTLFSGVETPIMIKLFDFLNLFGKSYHSHALSDNTLLMSSGNFIWDSAFRSMGQIVSLGIILYTSYGMIILMLGVILLLAIVGPILLTHRPTKPLHNSSDSSSSITPRNPSAHSSSDSSTSITPTP